VDLSVTASAADGVATISADGEIDLLTGPLLLREIKQALADDDIRQIVVNLAQTRFLDSTGVAVLLAGHREAGPHDVAFRVEAAQGIVLEVLRLTGVWDKLSGSGDA
jgi:anti-sigma B factor antagonist